MKIKVAFAFEDIWDRVNTCIKFLKSIFELTEILR